MKTNYKVIIIGGGAAGLMTAITAKTSDILILEANSRAGKKLLATGNGKCNLLNEHLSADKYNDKKFVAPIFKKYNFEFLQTFFNNLGLLLRIDYEGRCYPFSESANSVLDVLRRAVEKRNVEIACNELVTAIKKENGGFKVVCNDGKTFQADKVVLATGSNAGFGTDSLKLVSDMVATVGFCPSLAPIITETTAIAGLNGVRVKCNIKLIMGKNIIAEEKGEILFRTYGVSGIAAFNLSSHLSRYSAKDATLSFDFLGDTKEMFCNRHIGVTAEQFLSGVFHKMLNLAILKYARVGVEEIVDKTIMQKLLNAATDFRIKVLNVSDMTLAQVATGGVKTVEINNSTLEAKGVKGLYFAGEAINVDGKCGGYNLSWAWVSALTVAESLN